MSHHHHYLKPPFGIVPRSWCDDFLDDPYRLDTVVGPPCTLPCKDEEWA